MQGLIIKNGTKKNETWIILVGLHPNLCGSVSKIEQCTRPPHTPTRQQQWVDMAASATAVGAANLCYSASQHRHSKPASKKPMGTLKFVIQNPVHLSRTRAETSFPIRALDPQTEEEEEKENDSNRTGAFTSPQVTFFHWVNLLILFLPIISLNSVDLTNLKWSFFIIFAAFLWCKQEDLDYLWKLIAGSVVGGGVIKYGSIVFPEITRPNLVQALIMISTPVVVAVFLLVKRSRAETRSEEP